MTATAPRSFARKRISHKEHTNKNQKLISHRSESDVCEIVLLIFLGNVGGTRLPNGAFMQKASCRKWHELLAHRRGIFCPSPNLFQKHMFLTCDFLSKPMNFPMISFATRCRLHVDSRANRCDQKLNLPIPVSKVSCHLANKMSANVWHTSYVDQYDTTCCGHDYNQVEPSGTKTGSKPLCLDF